MNDSWIEKLCCILFFAQAINFRNQYAVLFALCAMISLIYLVLTKRVLYKTKGLLTIVLFAVSSSMIMFAWNQSLKTVIFHYFLFPILAYIVGISVAYWSRSNSKKGKSFFFSIIIGECIYGFSSFVNYWRNSGTVNFSTRYGFNDLWTGTYISATKIALLMTPFACLLFYYLVANLSMRKKVIGCMMCFGVIFTNFLFGNRLIIVSVTISSMAAGVVFYQMKNNQKQQRRFTKAIVSVLGLAVLVFAIFRERVMESFQKSEMYLRLSGNGSMLKSGRSDLYIDFLNQFYLYPFGGQKIVMSKDEGFFHNIFFDSYNMMGAIPTILLILIFVWLFAALYQSYKRKKFTNEEIASAFCVLVGIFLSFQVEPVMQGDIYLFYYTVIALGFLEYSNIGMVYNHEHYIYQ